MQKRIKLTSSRWNRLERAAAKSNAPGDRSGRFGASVSQKKTFFEKNGVRSPTKSHTLIVSEKSFANSSSGTCQRNINLKDDAPHYVERYGIRQQKERDSKELFSRLFHIQKQFIRAFARRALKEGQTLCLPIINSATTEKSS